MLGSRVLRLTLVGVSAALAFGAAAVRADACSCVFSRQLACEYRWKTAAVFTARIIGIENATRTLQFEGTGAVTVSERRVRLAVREAFVGAAAGSEIDIFTGAGGGDCGFRFEPGREYLIYAYARPDGSLQTGICDPTRRIEDAADHLAYLRAVPSMAPLEGRVIGLVTHDDLALAGSGSTSPPFAGARIVAEGGGLVRRGVARGDGTYEIRVPPGRYRLRAEMPRGMYASIWRADVELKDARGCAVADVGVRYDGHVTGRVVTQSGQPVSGFPVKLVGQDRTREVFEDRTAADGRFDLGHVSADRFTLSTPLMPVEFERRGIVVKPSERVNLGRVVVSDRDHFVSIRGVVVDASGGAVAGASVYLYWDLKLYRNIYEQPRIGPEIISDANGRFVLTVVDGQPYRIVAEQFLASGSDFARAEVRGLVATPDAVPIVLTVQHSGN